MRFMVSRVYGAEFMVPGTINWLFIKFIKI